ncbi:chitinase [Aliivibrio sifiae]|uniref:Carbohydrate-binding protein n=1 Tax=Aliivibrio sifiae TaxID=566293 RepID=A0A2S7XI31_9GAMM|nr:chitinase [Aliivibrio sifiae]PQJ93377.1 carbohydrate-binding protein [Aliivibrio sifiae]GLR74542.1 carbohydrate-binding protein [Aliivibrio sifiae]
MFKLAVLPTLLACSFAANSFTMNPQPDPENPTGYIVTQAEIDAAEAAKTADPMYDVWAKALATQPNSIVDAIDTGLATNPANVKRVERVFPASEWFFLTQMAAPEYSYTRFLQAIGKFPAFCGDYTDGRDSDAICKKSIVTAFAHFSQETGGHIAIDNTWDNPLGLEEWQQALVHVREMGWSEGQEGYTTGCGQNDWQNKRWPCAAGQGYFGRGAKQLSYHFNYGAFSEVMYDGDATVLLNNPALVADSWLNLASAIWFFLTPQAPKPAMLHVIDRTWSPSQRETDAGIGYGFGTTINVINGGIECGEQNKDKGQPVNRIRYWEGLAKHYQIPAEADEMNTCWQQTPYGSLNLNGATDVLYTNWDGNWKYYSDRPEGASFECELVGFQTAYSALVPGDYEKCVTNFYESHANWPATRVVETLPTDPSEPTDPTDPTNTWDASKVYNTGDQVVLNGVTYQAKWWNQGENPVTGTTGVWEVISGTPTTNPVKPTPPTPVEPTPPIEPAPVEPTPPTVPADPNSTWDTTATYNTGDQVTINGVTYQAQWWTQGNNPETSGEWGVWKRV